MSLDETPQVLATPSRIAVFTVWSLFHLVMLGSAGCHVGTADTGDGETPDASGGGDDDSDDAGDGIIDAGDDGGDLPDAAWTGEAPTACQSLIVGTLPVVPHPPRYDYDSGGKGCITDGCHGTTTGIGAPAFTIGGALYDAETGGAPVAGASIFVEDSAGKVLRLITSESGYFFSTEPVSGNLTTFSSGCPTANEPMATPASGNCNQSGCHTTARQAFLERP